MRLVGCEGESALLPPLAPEFEAAEPRRSPDAVLAREPLPPPPPPPLAADETDAPSLIIDERRRPELPELDECFGGGW